MQIDFSTLIAIVGCLIGILGFYYGRMAQTKKDVEEVAKLNVKVENLIEGINKLQIQQSKISKDITNIVERIIVLEQVLNLPCKTSKKFKED